MDKSGRLSGACTWLSGLRKRASVGSYTRPLLSSLRASDLRFMLISPNSPIISCPVQPRCRQMVLSVTVCRPLGVIGGVEDPPADVVPNIQFYHVMSIIFLTSLPLQKVNTREGQSIQQDSSNVSPLVNRLYSSGKYRLAIFSCNFLSVAIIP